MSIKFVTTHLKKVHYDGTYSFGGLGGGDFVGGLVWVSEVGGGVLTVGGESGVGVARGVKTEG